MLPSHLDLLYANVALHSDAAAFKVPIMSATDGRVSEWHTITYQQFQSDVDKAAAYWSQELLKDGVCKRSIVGLWYVDVLPFGGMVNLMNEFQVWWDDLHGRCSHLWRLESRIYSPAVQSSSPRAVDHIRASDEGRR